MWKDSIANNRKPKDFKKVSITLSHSFTNHRKHRSWHTTKRRTWLLQQIFKQIFIVIHEGPNNHKLSISEAVEFMSQSK